MGEDGSGKGWTDRQTQSYGRTHTQKSLERGREKKKSRQKGRQKITGRQSDRQAPNGQRERKADNRFSIISNAGNIVLLSTVMPISHDWISLLEASTLKPSLDSKHPSTSIEWSGEEAGYDPGSIYTTIQSLLVHSLSVYYDLNSSWWGREHGLYFPPKLSFKFISTNALFNSIWSKVPHNCIHTWAWTRIKKEECKKNCVGLPLHQLEQSELKSTSLH